MEKEIEVSESPPPQMKVYHGQDGLFYKATSPKSANDCWIQFPSLFMLAVLPPNGKGFNQEFITHATDCLKQGLIKEDFFQSGGQTNA